MGYMRQFQKGKTKQIPRVGLESPTPQVLHYLLGTFPVLVTFLLGFCMHCMSLGLEPRTLCVAGKALQFRSQSFWDYVHKLKKSPEFAQLLCSECPNLPCQTLLKCQKARVASSGTLHATQGFGPCSPWNAAVAQLGV